MKLNVAGSHQYSRRSRREGLGRSEIDIGTFLANNSDRQRSPRLECMNCRLRQKDKTLISILFLDFCKKVKRRRRRGWWRRRSSSSRGWPYSPSQDQIWSVLFYNHRELFRSFLYWNQEIKSSMLGSAIFCLSSLHCAKIKIGQLTNFTDLFKISVFKSLLMRRPPGAESGCFTPRVWPRVPIWGGEFDIYQQNILIRFVWVISWGGEFDISAKHLDLFESYYDVVHPTIKIPNSTRKRGSVLVIWIFIIE